MRNVHLKQYPPQKHKLNILFISIVLISLVGVLTVLVMTLRRSPAAMSTQGKSTLVVGQGAPNPTTFQLETVTSSADQAKGLIGRAGLAENSGMLFKYEAQEQHCIWMKDMRFDIDVVWFDANKRVTSIVPNMKPVSYPQSYCAESLYVIELNAGGANSHGLRVGQVAQF